MVIERLEQQLEEARINAEEQQAVIAGFRWEVEEQEIERQDVIRQRDDAERRAASLVKDPEPKETTFQRLARDCLGDIEEARASGHVTEAQAAEAVDKTITSLAHLHLSALKSLLHQDA